MAETDKILKNIENDRAEISRTVNLLSQKDYVKNNVEDFIKQRPFESAIFAFSSGVIIGIVSNRFKSLIKFTFFVYSLKQVLSNMNKNNNDSED